MNEAQILIISVLTLVLLIFFVALLKDKAEQRKIEKKRAEQRLRQFLNEAVEKLKEGN